MDDSILRPDESLQPHEISNYYPEVGPTLPGAKANLIERQERHKALSKEILQKESELYRMKVEKLGLEKLIGGLQAGIARIEIEETYGLWCEVGAVVKFKQPDGSFVFGKVEGRTDKNLWLSTKEGRLVREKMKCIGHLYKMHARDFDVPFEPRKQEDCVDPE